MKKILMICATVMSVVAILLGPRFSSLLAGEWFRKIQAEAKEAAVTPATELDIVDALLERSDDIEEQIRAVAKAKLQIQEQEEEVRRISQREEQLQKKVQSIWIVLEEAPNQKEFRFADEIGVKKVYSREDVERDLGRKVEMLESLKSQVSSARELHGILSARYNASLDSLHSLQRDADQAKVRVTELRTKHELIAEMTRKSGIMDITTQAKDLTEANRLLNDLNSRLSQRLAELDVRNSMGADQQGINPLSNEPVALRERILQVLGKEETSINKSVNPEDIGISGELQ